jgi:hypothetical protein
MCAACTFKPSFGLDGGPGGDGRFPDTPPGAICFGTPGTSLFTYCYPAGTAPPMGSATLSPNQNQFDTHDDCQGQQSQPNAQVVTFNGQSVCMIAVGDLTIDKHIQFQGTNPLVLLGTNTITVTSSGIVDASSSVRSFFGGGPNSDAATCNAGTGGNAGGGGGGNGGGGAGFGTPGGIGGTSTGNTATGAGGAAVTTVTLQGGCKGGKGGDGAGQSRGGDGGDSGGAVYLLAGKTITIDGSVIASGGGGNGADPTSGGGGGGTGGLIGLDAATLTIAAGAHVVSNGGAGGGGGDAAIHQGGDGGDGTTVGTSAAVGGAGGTGGGPGGGSGATGTDLAIADGGSAGTTSAATGAGGGGGGAGIIWVVTQSSLTTALDISPPPRLHP